MCGRFTSRSTAAELAEHFDVDEVVAPDLGPRFNVAPTDPVYAVAETAERVRRLGTFRWGLVPFWADDLKVGARMINARAEGIADKPAFRRSFERRRCIVPADGFYEWERVAKGARKQPWYISGIDGEPLAFAGLWDTWRAKDDDAHPVRSCTIITGPPNAKVARLHDRMPVVLPREAWDEWLDPGNHHVAGLQSLLVAAPDDLFDLVPVSTAVNRVTNDGPDLIRPVTDDGPETRHEPEGS